MPNLFTDGGMNVLKKEHTDIEPFREFDFVDNFSEPQTINTTLKSAFVRLKFMLSYIEFDDENDETQRINIGQFFEMEYNDVLFLVNPYSEIDNGNFDLIQTAKNTNGIINFAFEIDPKNNVWTNFKIVLSNISIYESSFDGNLKPEPQDGLRMYESGARVVTGPPGADGKDAPQPEYMIFSIFPTEIGLNIVLDKELITPDTFVIRDSSDNSELPITVSGNNPYQIIVNLPTSFWVAVEGER